MRAWFLVLLAACGSSPSDDVDDGGSALEGVYAVDSYAENDMGCDAGAAVEGTAPFSHVEISVLSFMGSDAMMGHGCDDASGCDGGLFATYNFETFDDSSAFGVVKVTTYSSGTCTMDWQEATLSASSGGITISEEVYRVTDQPGADLDDCTSQQDAWTGSRDCVALAVIEASAL